MTHSSVAAAAFVLLLTGATPVTGGASRVDEIVARHIAARGGAERLSALQTIRATGVMRQRGFVTPATLWTQRPDRARIEITLKGITLVQAYDGETAWWVNPLVGAGTPRVMPADLGRALAQWVDFDGPLVGYKDKGHTIAYAGEDTTASGERRYELTVTLAGGGVWSVFIDAESYLEVARSYELPFAGKTRTVAFQFDEFRTVDGVTLPGTIEGTGPDGVRYVMTFDAYDLNVDVDPALFIMPAAATGQQAATGEQAATGQQATTEEQAATGLVELSDVGPLQERFNDDKGSVRAVMLLSPNCPVCRRVFSGVKTWLDESRDEDLRVHVVFMPMLGADDVESAAERAVELADPRLTCYWDPNRVTALAWQELYALDMPAWDMFFLYDPQVVWRDEVPMAEMALTGHQPIGNKIPKVDVEALAAEARNLAGH